MIPQDMIIEIFLFNPTIDLLVLIDDVTLAMRLVKRRVHPRNYEYSLIDISRNWIRLGQEDKINRGNLDYRTIAKYTFKKIIKECALYDGIDYIREEIIYSYNSSSIYSTTGGHISYLCYLAAKYGKRDILDDIFAYHYITASDHQEIVTLALRSGIDITNTRYFLELGTCTEDYSVNSILGAARGGDRKLVKTLLIMNHSLTSNDIAIAAAEGGLEDIVKEMIDLGANDYNNIAKAAAYGGLHSIVLYGNNYKEIAINAIRGGNPDIAMSIIENCSFSSLSNIARNAARHGYIEIVNRIIELGVSNFNAIASGAAKGGHIEIVVSMIKNKDGANNFKSIVCSAAKGGHLNIVMLFIDKCDNIEKYLKRYISGYDIQEVINY